MFLKQDIVFDLEGLSSVFSRIILVIVAFLENATIGYSLESLYVCVCVCACFCTITQKEIDLGTRNRNTLQYMKIARTSSILSFIGSRSRSL